MKIIQLFIFLISLSFTQAQSSENLIHWQANKKLTYNDFKSPVDENSSNAALSNTSIKLDMGYNSKGFNYKVNCVFDKSKSWMRIKNEKILAHEQGHFDITELYARKLNEAMKNYVFNQSTASKDMSAIYQRIMTEHEQTQQEYDRESDYSRNAEGQAKWSKKIANELKELEEYAGY